MAFFKKTVKQKNGRH